MIRAIALSLALLIGMGTIIPLMTDYSSAKVVNGGKRLKKKKIKKYSRVWWRRYHAKQKRKRNAVAYRRAARARQILLARKQIQSSDAPAVVASAPAVQETAPAMLPTGEAAPSRWKKSLASSSELQYRINDEGGNQMGAASLTVVGPATGPDSDDFRNRAVGGVNTSSLRRIVIDKMMKESGWVTNDFHKTINGKKVYVVVGQANVGGIVQSRMYYFTEVNGRIYSLATSAPENAYQRLAEESERVIDSLQHNKGSNQAGLK